jgi:hypothetical protein
MTHRAADGTDRCADRKYFHGVRVFNRVNRQPNAMQRRDLAKMRKGGRGLGSIAAGLVWATVAVTDGRAADIADQTTIPNFSSVDLPWVATEQDYLPPSSGPGPVSYDKAHPVMDQHLTQSGNTREEPLRLANLNNSNLKPWVVAFLKKANEDLLAGKQRYAARGNCMPGGVPQFLLYAGGFENLYLIQTPREVLMIHEADTQIRHVYMNVPHSAHPTSSWYGESVGHYEGDELIVDSIGFNDRTFLDDHYNVPHTTQLHVVERFRLIDGGKTLEVNFTVDDPGTFNAPWSAIVRYRHGRTPERLTEEPCAENNFHLLEYVHPPMATKPDF